MGYGRGHAMRTMSVLPTLMREHEITVTWNPAAATVQARATETAKTVTVKTN